MNGDKLVSCTGQGSGTGKKSGVAEVVTGEEYTKWQQSLLVEAMGYLLDYSVEEEERNATGGAFAESFNHQGCVQAVSSQLEAGS